MFYCYLNSDRVTFGSPLLIHPFASCEHVLLHICVPACTPTEPLLNGGLSPYFPCFSKTYSPQRKGHTHSLSTQPAKAKCMNGLTWPRMFHQSPLSNVPSAVNNTHHHPWWHTCWMWHLWPEKMADCFLLAFRLQVSAEAQPWSHVSQTQDGAPFFPPSSPESSSQNLCQDELIAFVALSLSRAGGTNEAPANSRPLTPTLTPWQWRFDFNSILNTYFKTHIGSIEDNGL